jgi:hypothetical protein
MDNWTEQDIVCNGAKSIANINFKCEKQEATDKWYEFLFQVMFLLIYASPE